MVRTLNGPALQAVPKTRAVMMLSLTSSGIRLELLKTGSMKQSACPNYYELLRLSCREKA